MIAPRSEVFRFKRGNPFELMGVDMKYEIGYYKDHPEWRVPALPRYIPYCIGIFCATDWGKASLVREKIIPLFINAVCGVIVFDWKGDDYVPYFPEEQVIRADEVSAEAKERDNVESITSYLLEKADYCGSSKGGGYRTAYKWSLRDAF